MTERAKLYFKKIIITVSEIFAGLSLLLTIVELIYPGFSTYINAWVRFILIIVITIFIILFFIFKGKIKRKLPFTIAQGRTVTINIASMLDTVDSDEFSSYCYAFGVNTDFTNKKASRDSLHKLFISEKIDISKSQKGTMISAQDLEKAMKAVSKGKEVPLNEARLISVYDNKTCKKRKIILTSSSKMVITKDCLKLVETADTNILIDNVFSLCKAEMIQQIILPVFGTGLNQGDVSDSVYKAIDAYFSNLEYDNNKSCVKNLVISVLPKKAQRNAEANYIDLLEIENYINAKMLIWNQQYKQYNITNTTKN